MKKIIFYSAIVCISLVACNDNKEADTNLDRFKKDVVIAKQFFEAISAKDSVKEASLLSEDLKWNGPAVGQDSLSKDVLMKGDKAFMQAHNEIKFADAEYYPSLDSVTYKITEGVRVYGTINSKFASSGKNSKVKYYAILTINDSGKINELTEYYNTEDLSKEF